MISLQGSERSRYQKEATVYSTSILFKKKKEEVEEEPGLFSNLFITDSNSI